MRARNLLSTITVLATLSLVATTAWRAAGQSADQAGTDLVLHFTHTGSEMSAQEIATAVRTITDMKDVMADFAQRTLTIHGTTDQVKLAEWLFAGLDRSTPVPADSAMHQYSLPGGADNVVRLFYVDRGQTVQEFQELATLVRTITETRRVFTYNDARAAVFRGTAEQMAMTDWMIGDIEKAAAGPRPHSVSRQYLLPASPTPTPNENVTQIFYLENTPTVQDFQELATLMRTIAEVRRVFTYNRPRAIAVRGTADQVAFVNWMFNELDQPVHGQRAHQSAIYTYPVVGKDDGTTARIFYLPHIATTQDFQKVATTIRTTAQIRRVFTWNEARAMAVRGTVDQIELAQRLLTDLEPADFPKGQN
jgi:hypothetical protein